MEGQVVETDEELLILMETTAKARLPTLKFIPKALRTRWAAALKASSDECTKQNAPLRAWAKYFCISKAILSLPPYDERVRVNNKKKNSHKQRIEANLERWKQGDWRSLIQEALDRVPFNKTELNQITLTVPKK